MLLPALVTTLLERLPVRPDADTFLRHLLELRDEVEPLRSRLGELVTIADDPGRSIADAEEVMGAMHGGADGAGGGVLVQYCVDELSFLVKLIAKQGVDPAEIAAKLPAGLERRLRSSAPAVLSTHRGGRGRARARQRVRPRTGRRRDVRHMLAACAYRCACASAAAGQA